MVDASVQWTKDYNETLNSNSLGFKKNAVKILHQELGAEEGYGIGRLGLVCICYWYLV